MRRFTARRLVHSDVRPSSTPPSPWFSISRSLQPSTAAASTPPPPQHPRHPSISDPNDPTLLDWFRYPVSLPMMRWSRRAGTQLLTHLYAASSLSSTSSPSTNAYDSSSFPTFAQFSPFSSSSPSSSSLMANAKKVEEELCVGAVQSFRLVLAWWNERVAAGSLHHSVPGITQPPSPSNDSDSSEQLNNEERPHESIGELPKGAGSKDVDPKSGTGMDLYLPAIAYSQHETDESHLLDAQHLSNPPLPHILSPQFVQLLRSSLRRRPGFLTIHQIHRIHVGDVRCHVTVPTSSRLFHPSWREKWFSEDIIGRGHAITVSMLNHQFTLTPSSTLTKHQQPMPSNDSDDGNDTAEDNKVPPERLVVEADMEMDVEGTWIPSCADANELLERFPFRSHRLVLTLRTTPIRLEAKSEGVLIVKDREFQWTVADIDYAVANQQIVTDEDDE